MIGRVPGRFPRRGRACPARWCPVGGRLCECSGPHMGGPYRAANRQWSTSSTPRGGGKTPPYGEPENGRL